MRNVEKSQQFSKMGKETMLHVSKAIQYSEAIGKFLLRRNFWRNFEGSKMSKFTV